MFIRRSPDIFKSEICTRREERHIRLELIACIEAAQEKKAEDVVVLDLRNLSDFTDSFVICHGSSDRQIEAIADAIEERLGNEHAVHPKHVEGRGSEWILMDYIDFVVHVFVESKRTFYALERLWGDAPQMSVRTDAAPALRRPASGRRSRPTASG